MTTLAQIKAKTEEVGDCWIWQGYISNTGYPVYGKGHKLVRRIVYELGGNVLKPRQPIITTCGDKCCVNPAHIKASTIAEVSKKAAEGGAWGGLARAAKIAATKRTAGKIDMETALAIRMSDESGPVLAERYGLHRSMVNRIKRGESWKDHTNPFFALGAR